MGKGERGSCGSVDGGGGEAELGGGVLAGSPGREGLRAEEGPCLEARSSSERERAWLEVRVRGGV